MQSPLPQADRDRRRADPGRARSADPVRLRLRPRDGGGRGRQCRRRDRYAGRHGALVRGHSRRQHQAHRHARQLDRARSCSRSMPRSARSRASPGSRYTVNLQNDPLKEYIARGTQILPPAPAAKLASRCGRLVRRARAELVADDGLRQPHQCRRRRLEHGHGDRARQRPALYRAAAGARAIPSTR